MSNFLDLTKSIFSKRYTIFNSLFIFLSARPKPKFVDFLLICSEADLNFLRDNIYYSRILDPLYLSLQSYSYVCCRFLWARSFSPSIKKDLYNKNSLFLVTQSDFLVYFFFRFIIKPKVIVSIYVPSRIKSIADKLSIPIIEPFHGFGIGPDDHVSGLHKFISTGSIHAAFDDQTYQTLKLNYHRTFEVVRCSHHYLLFDKFFGVRKGSFDSFIKLDSILCHLLDKLISGSDKTVSRPTILITLAWGYDGTIDFLTGILPNGIMPDSLISVLRTNTHINWLIKPHPVQLADTSISNKLFHFLDFHFEGCDHISFRNVDLFDTFDLLRLSILHITMNSSTIVEASMLGIPSIALCPTLQNGGLFQKAFEFSRKRSLLYVIPSETELLTKLINHLIDKSNGSHFESFVNDEVGFPSLSDLCIGTILGSVSDTVE